MNTRWRIGLLALVVAAVPAGAACGGDDGAPAPQAAVPAPDAAAPPTLPGPVRAELSVAAESVPKKAEIGKTATVRFKSRPGNSCQMEVRYGDGTSQRLAPALANDSGDVSWTWTLRASESVRDAIASVVCSGGARGQVDITVS